MSRFRISGRTLSAPSVALLPYLLLTSLALLGRLSASAQAPASDIPIGVTYICNGEHIYIENCNIRDMSDNANCMVAHPDSLHQSDEFLHLHQSRRAQKTASHLHSSPRPNKSPPQRPSSKSSRTLYNANVQKAEQPAECRNRSCPARSGAATPRKLLRLKILKSAKSGAASALADSPPAAPAINSSALLAQMLSSVLPGADKQPAPGPNMAGVFQGAGNWRLDFIDGGVLVNCASLSPNQEAYTRIRGNAPRSSSTPHPSRSVLTFRPDGSITGPGPVTIDGVVASGYVERRRWNGATQQDQYGNLYDSAGNRVPGNANAGHTVFAPRRATCPALSLSSKGAGVGIQTMQTDLLKTVFGGDKGPPTPPGIRMHGIFAASTGFSFEFFPESVILGCGPDSARAYPYTVVATAGGVVKIDAPDHPLNLAFRPMDRSTRTSGPYQVHGRIVTGQDDNDDFTFAPMEQTCNLAALAPSKPFPPAAAPRP